MLNGEFPEKFVQSNWLSIIIINAYYFDHRIKSWQIDCITVYTYFNQTERNKNEMYELHQIEYKGRNGGVVGISWIPLQTYWYTCMHAKDFKHKPKYNMLIDNRWNWLND